MDIKQIHRLLLIKDKNLVMITTKDKTRRNRLAYLALYYAIQGDDTRSEHVREMVRDIDKKGELAELGNALVSKTRG